MLRFETSHGDFSIELFEKEASRTVGNFLKYVEEGFYDGTRKRQQGPPLPARGERVG